MQPCASESPADTQAQQTSTVNSQPENRMPGTCIGRPVHKFLGQLVPMARKVVRGPMDTLLQGATGIESLADGLGMTSQRRFALQLEVGCQPSETIHLVPHLAGRSLGRSPQSCIHAAHPLQQRSQFAYPARHLLRPACACRLPASPAQPAVVRATLCVSAKTRSVVSSYLLSKSAMAGSTSVAENRGCTGVARPRMRSKSTADCAKYAISAGPPMVSEVESR